MITSELSKKLVVSNYNSDLEWLKMTHDYGFSADNTIIYDRSSVKKNWSHLGKTISSPNIGGNQYDVLRFIIENYDDLPNISIFIKGNLFSKSEENYYTTKERFIQGLNEDTFFSLWVDKCLALNDFRHLTYTTRESLDNGRLSQPVHHCDFSTNHNLEHRYFSRVQDLWDWCFTNSPKLNIIEFIPACNFVVPKNVILKYSINLYKKLLSILFDPEFSSDPTCAESHLIERTFYFMWNNDLSERND